MPFQQIECAFLKDEVGPILAKGLAETVIACPTDPVEYLAIWLLHYLQLQEVEQKERVVVEVEEREREEWVRAAQSRQARAAATIQRYWTEFMRTVEERRAREKKLVAAMREKEHEVEEGEEFREENLQVEEYDGMTDFEREKAVERAKALNHFRKAQAMVAALDKAAIASLKQLRKANASTVRTVRCCFYFAGYAPRQVRTWDQMAAALKPSVFRDRVLAFDPAAPGKKRRVCTRVRRILKVVQEEDVRQQSIAAFLLYLWCHTTVELRTAHEEDVKLKKEAGREVEEEEEEEEEQEIADPAERDPDEEGQRLIEEEERRRLAEEEARWRAERGEDEEGAEEAEE